MPDTRNIKGLRDLEDKLLKMIPKEAVGALKAATRDATKPVLMEMKAKAPVGKYTHRTYKGRLVPPGYLRKALNSRTKFDKNRGRAITTLGVEPEAFYGPQFLDKGIDVKERRIKRRKRTPTKYVRGKKLKRETITVKPYSIKPEHFFEPVFVSNMDKMIKDFSGRLQFRIEKVAKRKRK